MLPAGGVLTESPQPSGTPDRDDRCVLGGASLLGPPERPAEECPTCLHSLTIGRRLRGSRVLREKLFCVSACGFRGREKMKKSGASCFPQNSKTIFTDHQQLSSAICAAAFSSTHANLI